MRPQIPAFRFLFRTIAAAALLLPATLAGAQTPAEQQLMTINKQYQAQVVARDYDGAIESITRMLDVAAVGHVRVNRGQMLYARACFNALTGRKERALSDARAAVQAGFDDYNAFSTDSDLASLRDDPDFKAFLATLQRTSPAVERSPAKAPSASPQPAPVPPSAADEKQALIVHLKTVGRETRRVAALTENLRAAIAEQSAGEFEGVEFGDRGCTVYLSGPDAGHLYTATERVLRNFHPLRGSYVVKRFGRPGAKEVRVDLR